jgi:hemoglobin
MSETLQNVFSRKKHDATRETHDATLFEKLGGTAAVSTAVDVFYRKVVRDARINYFFFGVNMAEQAEKQKSFLSMAFGGPHQYTGRDMRRSHAKLIGMGMNDRHFDIVMDHLRDTLTELGVESTLVDAVLAIAESTREDVMGRSQAPAEGSSISRQQRTPGTQRSTAERPKPDTIGAILKGDKVALNIDTPLTDAVDVFVRGGYISLPVLDRDGKLVGIVTSTDLLTHLNR